MPKTTGSTGKRPEYRALEIMKVGAPVTPSELDKHVGTGAYSSKYMSFLKRDGFVITVNKDGRSVVSYTLVSSPEADKLPKGAFDRPTVTTQKVSAKKAPKAKAVTKTKAKAKAKVKVIPVDTSAFVLPEKKKVAARKAPRDTVEETFGDTGEVAGGSFSIDGGFDELDPRELA